MRAAIFIDGGYLLKQLQDAKIQPDYTRLAEFFLAPLRRHTQLDLMRCYFYYCPPWMSERPTESELRRMAAHDRFVADLQEGCDRWQVRLGKLERRRDGDKEVFAQKRVDVQLSVDLVHHTAAGHIQHAIVIAGDSDFIPAVVAAKQSGATLTLWCDRDRSVHKELMLHADEVHYIDWKRFPGRPLERPEHADGERGDRDGTQAATSPAQTEPTAAKRSSSRRGGRGRSVRPAAPAPGASSAASSAASISSLSTPATAPTDALGKDAAPVAAAGFPSSVTQAPPAPPAALTADAALPTGSERPVDTGSSGEPAPRLPAKRGGRTPAAPRTTSRPSTRQPPRAKDAAGPLSPGAAPSPPRAPGRAARAPVAAADTDARAPAARSDRPPSEPSQGEKAHNEEPGDNIGNTRPGDDANAPAQKSSRRRRGGRGRRRKNGSSGTPPTTPS